MEVLSEHEWHARREHASGSECAGGSSRDLRAASRNERPSDRRLSFRILCLPPWKALRSGIPASASSCGETPPASTSIRRAIRKSRTGITANAQQAASPAGGSHSLAARYAFSFPRTARLFRVLGLHEWAMVYRTESIRHGQWPLRVTSRQISEIVESLGPRCTHYDAFRFFSAGGASFEQVPTDTPHGRRAGATGLPARKHGSLQVGFQAGAFYRFRVGRGLFRTRDAKFARSTCSASPYDFTALGYFPVKIETPEGRAEYEAKQREFALYAAPLRERWSQFAIRSSKKCRAAPLIARAAPQRSRSDDLPPIMPAHGRKSTCPRFATTWLSSAKKSARKRESSPLSRPTLTAMAQQRSPEPSPGKVELFGVASIEEAVELSGLDREILLLSPSAPGERREVGRAAMYRHSFQRRRGGGFCRGPDQFQGGYWHGPHRLLGGRRAGGIARHRALEQRRSSQHLHASAGPG